MPRQVQQTERRLVWSSQVAGVVILLGVLVGRARPLSAATSGIYVSVLVGYAWFAVLSPPYAKR